MGKRKNVKDYSMLLILFCFHSAILGVVSTANMMTRLVNQKIKPEDKVSEILVRQFRKIKKSTCLGQVSHILEKEPFALVVDDKDAIIAIVSHMDVLGYINNSPDSAAAAVAKASI